HVFVPVEETQLHLGGVFGEEGKIDAGAVPGCSERIGSARPNSHDAPQVAGSGWTIARLDLCKVLPILYDGACVGAAKSTRRSDWHIACVTWFRRSTDNPRHHEGG